MKLNNKGNWSLIGLLVAVAIVAVLAATYFGGRGGIGTVKSDSNLLDSKSTKQTTVGRAIDTGKSVDCQQRINQIRTGVTNYKAMNGTEANPPTLKDIGLSVSPEYFKCPVSGQAYQYDPATGTARCPTHPNF